MANNCSFFAITGGKCGYDRRDSTKSVKNVPLLSCDRDITSHKSLLSIYADEVENEVDLILARSSLFSRPLNISEMVVCPAHRSALGTGWSRDSANCKIPDLISKHRANRRPKADRGLNKVGSQLVLRECGIFLPIGTGAFCLLLLLFIKQYSHNNAFSYWRYTAFILYAQKHTIILTFSISFRCVL